LRVLHVTNFFDPDVGYAEYYLAKCQLKLGLDIKVLCSDYSVQGKKLQSPGYSIVDGVGVSRLNTAFLFRGDVCFFNPIRFEQILREFSPEVVYCRSLLAPLSQEILSLKKKYRYKIVGDLITGSGTDAFSRVSDFGTTLLLRHFLRFWLLSNTDAFCVCSPSIEKWVGNSLKYPKSKIFFVPLGADHELFKPNLQARLKTRALLGLSDNDVVAIHTGKLLPHRRLSDLLIASKSVIEQFPNFKIVFVGKGSPSYERVLKSLVAELRIERNFIKLEPVHRIHLNDFYNAADFAVWPGGFSISMIEAMSSGLPLIIPKSDWTKHYLEYSNGFSFRAGDVGALSSLLRLMVENQELRESLAARSRKLIEDKLNWNSIAKKHIEIYNKCLEHA
jgi:glycosyltransferase involved in cell wall biosynthesis